MSQSYIAQRVHSSQEKEALVTSNFCSYGVILQGDEIRLRGPGVDEKSESEEYPKFENFLDFAIYIVMMFENGLWPKE